jgi:hypothetical protein
MHHLGINCLVSEQSSTDSGEEMQFCCPAKYVLQYITYTPQDVSIMVVPIPTALSSSFKIHVNSGLTACDSTRHQFLTRANSKVASPGLNQI